MQKAVDIDADCFFIALLYYTHAPRGVFARPVRRDIVFVFRPPPLPR